MDVKPTYRKFHNFGAGNISYGVTHPDFTEAKMYVETRQSGSGWIAYETYDEQTAVTGKTRSEAVANKLKDAQYVVRGLRLQELWHSKEEQLVSGSTAWHALYSGRENADDTVAEGNVTDNSTEYWELALSGYNSLMDELEATDRELAQTRNLIDLPVCSWCGQHATEVTPINDDHEFCQECLPIATLSHEWDSLNAKLTPAGRTVIDAACRYADGTVDDYNPKRWFEVALAKYTALTGEATSVAQKPVMAIDAPSGASVQVTGDEHGALVTISFVTGVRLGHLWLRADNAARKWAKEFGEGRTLIRVSSGGSHTAQAEEHRFIYVWVI